MDRTDQLIQLAPWWYDGDAVGEALADLEDVDVEITAADMTATITRRRASIDMSLEADTLNDAGRLFLANLRTVLHAAGCGTPNWPTYRPLNQTPNVRQIDHADA